MNNLTWKDEGRGQDSKESHRWKENFEHAASCCHTDLNDWCKGEEDRIRDTLNNRGDMNKVTNCQMNHL